MKFQCFKDLLLLCVFSLLLASCASINPTVVSDKDRDTTGNFDGRWKMTQKAHRATQQVGQSRFNCTFKNRSITMYVKDSVARIPLGKYVGTGNVSGSGRFRVEIPTDLKFTTGRGFSDSGQLITYIYQGKLAQSKTSGLFTIGKKALNNAGCSTKLTIENGVPVSIYATEGHPRTKRVVGEWSFTSNNIPETSKPSSLSTRLTIQKDGKSFLGTLEISVSTNSSCGTIVSTSKTRVSANLHTEDSLIMKALEDSIIETGFCEDITPMPTEFLKGTLILLNFSVIEKQQQLTFKTKCGLSIDKRCVFERPPLVKVK